ncbi:MAG TPA: CoA transferase [Gemmatimonadaceae bacterium]|nr:CoA transferase [Gemmatimonadaceae bacterium]
MSRVLAGPVCSMMLGDLGADVIKVEQPGSGDETRGWGPPFSADGQSAYFLAINRNKKSIALELSEEADRAILLDLMRGADVVLENFLPDSLGRLRLDPLDLLDQNQSLIWCTISGFGPASRRPGYDFVIQAECGWMAITGDPDGAPMKTGVALADVMAGKDAAIAILAAVAERGAGGRRARERRINVSLADSARAALVNVAQNVLVSGNDAKRWGNAHPNLVPYQLFEASDRSMVIAVGNDGQWRACTEALGLSDLADDESLATNSGRVKNRDRVVKALAARVGAMGAQHWIGRLQSAGVPCGVVRTVAETLAVTNADPRAGMPPSVPGTVRLPPPKLDEHGHAIRTLGWRAFR